MDNLDELIQKNKQLNEIDKDDNIMNTNKYALCIFDKSLLSINSKMIFKLHFKSLLSIANFLKVSQDTIGRIKSHFYLKEYFRLHTKTLVYQRIMILNLNDLNLLNSTSKYLNNYINDSIQIKI